MAPDQDATLIDLATLRSSGAVLRAMVRRDPLKFSLGALGAALVSVANVSIPLAMGRAVQVGLVDHRFSGFALWLGVVALAYLLRAGATTLRLHSNMSASMLQHDMRVQALARTVDPTGLGSARRLPGDLLTVMITDARTTSRALVALTGVPGQLVTLIGALVALLLIDWRLSVAVLVLTPLLVLMSLKGLAPIQERTRAERRAEAAAAGIAADLTEG
ncbi:ABC transporter ATP-binding protein, partial [Propionibacterium freudenreichii]